MDRARNPSKARQKSTAGARASSMQPSGAAAAAAVGEGGDGVPASHGRLEEDDGPDMGDDEVRDLHRSSHMGATRCVTCVGQAACSGT